MFNNTTSYKSSVTRSYSKKSETATVPKGNGNFCFLNNGIGLEFLCEITRSSEREPAVTTIQLTTFTINLLVWNFWEQIIGLVFFH